MSTKGHETIVGVTHTHTHTQVESRNSLDLVGMSKNNIYEKEKLVYI